MQDMATVMTLVLLRLTMKILLVVAMDYNDGSDGSAGVGIFWFMLLVMDC